MNKESGSNSTVPHTMLVLLNLMQASGEELCNKHVLFSHDLQLGLQLMVLLKDLQQGTASQVHLHVCKVNAQLLLYQRCELCWNRDALSNEDSGHRILLSLRSLLVSIDCA